MPQLFKRLREVSIKSVLRALSIISISITIVAFWVVLYLLFTTFILADDDLTSSIGLDADSSEDACNVLGIDLHGFLVTYPLTDIPEDDMGGTLDVTASQNILAAIKDANSDSSIKAILLEVDSVGGYPVAGEEVANALRNSSKPTVAMIRSVGASAAYLAASGAKTIFASKFSDVGSIGITISYLDESIKNQRDGLTYHQLSSGKFKDMFDTSKPLTAEERTLVLRDLNISHNDFVKAIAENRKLDINKVRALADGSSMLGEMALQNRLIDKIGSYTEVEKYLEGVIGEKPDLCW